ncbi:DUF3987 domain-containing protein [Nostoc sp. CCY0012]|uniref:DUF3987 domain-containing protein n=1 Tax=Nostoc sp. CCY0012 TaxID=1056123 RepID=UPI0039C75530
MYIPSLQTTASAPEKNFTIDKSQALAHLTALGYKPEDTVYLRSFYPSNDPRKKDDRGRSSEVRNSKQLISTANAWQSDGRGVYFVVNGGGQADKDVTTCRAIFYEHDNLDKESQKKLWHNLSLPEPSLQIDTGNKSIHSYWVFDQLINPQQWKQLESDLLEYANADRSLKNPSRVMRLAGCWHFGPNNVPNGQTQIILNTGKRYSYKELRTIIPTRAPKNKTVKPISINDLTDGCPLYFCLSKENRELIDIGTLSGARNTKAYSVACDLIGTAGWLDTFGYRYSGNPRDIFDDYCSKCSPPLGSDNASEPDNIWKSAMGDNPQPTLSEDYIIKCIKTWQRRERILSSERASVNNFNNVIPNPPITKFTLSPDELLAEIDSLFEKNYKQSELEARLLELATKTGHNFGNVFKLYKSRSQEQEQSVDRKIAGRQLPSLLEAQKAELLPSQILWGDGGKLALLLESIANAMPVSSEALLTTLFPVAGSRIGTSSLLVVDPRTRYTVTSIFWTCVVAPTGTLKTPAQKTIINPLNQLEANEYKNWKQAVDDYKTKLKHCGKGDKLPEEPAPRKRLIIQGSSSEARMKIHGENPRGILYWRDEWAGYITGLNKYRGGKGDDSQLDLSEFNGDALFKDVVDSEKCIYLERSAISRTGNTQPEILKQFQSRQNFADHAGEFARWLFCLKENPLAYINLFRDDDGTGQQLQNELLFLYEGLGKLPEYDYFLTTEGKKIYQAYQHQLINWLEAESHPGLKATYPKLQTYLGRFALWLHLVNAVLAGETTPGQFIDGQTMAVACQIIDFYVAQARLLYALNSEQQTLAGNLLKIKEFAERHPDGFTVSDLKRTINALKKIPTAEIDQDCQLLMEMSIICRYSKKYYPSNNRKNVGGVGGQLVAPPTTEMSTRQGIERNVGGVGGISSTCSKSKSTTIDINEDLAKSELRENYHQQHQQNGEKSIQQGLVTTNSPPIDHQLSPIDHQLSPIDHQLSGIDTLTTKDHQLSPIDQDSKISPTITKGSRIKVHCPGSKRHGLEGVVIKVKTQQNLLTAIVLLENTESDLRKWECPIPGNEMMRLEVIL